MSIVILQLTAKYLPLIVKLNGLKPTDVKYHEKIGVVFQNSVLDGELTVNNGQQLIPFKHPENSEYILNYCCWGMVGIMHTAIRRNKFDITELSELADKLLTLTLATDGLDIK